MAGAKLALGDIQDFLVVLASDVASLYTGHNLLSCKPLGADSYLRCLLQTPNSCNKWWIGTGQIQNSLETAWLSSPFSCKGPAG
jgi:hypothetical protein